ncbi:MAG: PucR family transcriptional regulator [Ruminococcus sp.]|jgi:hypothetical protein
MKLSMAIIEHWIQRYHPISTIVDDAPTISAVRLFTYAKALNPQYLYVGRNRDFFEHSQSDEVLLVHKKSVISLNTQELEDVFDVLLDAFTFYQNWEQKMLSAFGTANPEQTIIDACKDIFGPMFFTTMGLQVTAFSRQYPVGSVNRNWDDFWHYGALSPDSLMIMQAGQYLQKASQIWKCETFYEENVDNYPYSMLISQENAFHTLTGHLTIISNEPFQEYHRHLAIYLRQALCLVAPQKKTDDHGSVTQRLLQDFLQGRNQSPSTYAIFYQLQGWDPEMYSIIIILKQKNGTLDTYRYHLNALQDYYPNGLFFIHPISDQAQDREIVCCLPIDPSGELGDGKRFGLNVPEKMLKIADILHLNCYCSYAFHGIEHVQIQYTQAKACLSRKKRHYYDCGLTDLASLNNSPNYRRLALHPVLEQILEYDRQKNTSFYHILKVYLRCERNRGLAAQQLFMHKNTLVYRIERITALFALNLDDPYEREYLLLSFRCLESVQSYEHV